MRLPRYAIYDTFHRVYLLRVELPTGEAGLTYTLWTRNAAEALRFPGAKSARRMLGQLGARDAVIINGRGVRL